jgi:phosphomannomutase
MRPVIKFGTDGWRGVIADDFTFTNLERVALATARFYRKHKNVRNGIVVGYDARFMGKEFAQRVAEVIAGAGIPVKLADGVVSTPMVSLLTKLERAAAGIVITASHNPPRYSGFKIKGDFGGPAFPEIIAKVEKELGRVMALKSLPKPKATYEQLIARKKIIPFPMAQRYRDDIAGKIDLEKIRRSGLRILYDTMYGAGQGVLDGLMPGITQLHTEYNPSFAGTNPEPLAHNLPLLISTMTKGGFDIGFASDGDADRVGAVDEKGNFVDSHRIFALLLKYFVEQKQMTGAVVKSFSVSSMINQQCAKYGLKLFETQIGFKYICRLMTQEDVLIGGEESGGLGVKGHLPERDGIFLGLMLCELMAVRGKPLSALVDELMQEYGNHEFNRIDLHLTEKEKTAIMKKFSRGVKEIGGFPVIGRQETDGYKFLIENGWVLVRASGTEPLIRFYAEADSKAKVDVLLKAATGR